MFLPLFSAVLGILSFSSFNFSYIFGFIFLVPVFVFLLKEEKFWRLVLGIFIFKIILATATLYFAFDPYGFILSVFVFLGLPTVVFLLKKLTRKISWPSAPHPSKILTILFLPLLWLFFENLQAQYSFLPTYVGTAGGILGQSPFLGLASIGGLNTLGFFTILVNTLIVLIISNFIKKSSSKLNPVRNIISNGVNLIAIVIVIVIVIVGWQISRIKLQQNSDFYESHHHILRVALISNNEKFDEEFLVFKDDIFTEAEKNLAKSMVGKKINLLKTDLINKKIDLLILPEDMIDIEIWNDADRKALEKFNISNDGILIEKYSNLAKELNIYLAATFTTIRNNQRYNSTLLFNPKGELVDIYDKAHLAIGGEYWPLGNWRPFYYNWLQKITPNLDIKTAIFNRTYQYASGKRKLLQDNKLAFASLICIEIHYPNEVKQLKNFGAQFISHTSTNRWISLGLKNYLNLTNNLRKIEAVWLKIPILINGREEVAGIVTPDGKMDSVGFENSANKNY